MSLGKVRILLLEDNPADVQLIKMALAHSKIDSDLVTFDDGESALRHIQDEASPLPDVIILDVKVPKAEGTEVMSAIRQNVRFAAVPVVALSSSDSPRDVNAMTSLGADCYLTKPADLDEFMKVGEAILECMKMARSRPEAGKSNCST